MIDGPPIKERARGRWHGILPALGIDAKLLTGKHGPCPQCGGKDRFRWDDKDGTGSWICSQCGAGDGVSLVMKVNGIEFKEAVKRIEANIGSAPVRAAQKALSDEEVRARKNRLWTSCKPIAAGDTVAKYLANRGLDLAAYPPSLRCGSGVKYQDHADGKFGPASFHPAMVAMVTGKDGKPVTLHRTYLTGDGRKASLPAVRKLMGAPAKALQGAAVRLAPHEKVLGIAEGIETALAAAALHSVPCWAAINTALMASWEPPEGVEEVYVFADNDEHFAGLKAGGALANRLVATRGIRVTFALPERRGEDWNDVLQRERPRAA